MAENFKWRNVSEKEKAEIRRDSKKLLDEFSLKLEKVRASEGHFTPDTLGYTERCDSGKGFREEGEGWDTDADFRDLIFLNAPFVEGDSIVAEKGGWK